MMPSDSSKLAKTSADEWDNVRSLVRLSKRVINGKKHRQLVRDVHEKVQASQEMIADQRKRTPAPLSPTDDLSRVLDQVETETAQHDLSRVLDLVEIETAKHIDDNVYQDESTAA